MPDSVVLLPSPLVGATTMQPLAEALAGLGHRVVVAALPAGLDRPDAVMAAFAEAAGAPARPILVPHSNAGLYAPAVAARAGARGIVFMDAALPPSEGRAPLAPAQLREHLNRLVGADGLLPPWTDWWDEEDVAPLFPTPAVRRRVEAGQPRLPLEYFACEVEAPRGWSDRACAYLAFGGTYAEEITRARALGWPVGVLSGGHLHHLHAPRAVAEQVRRLADHLPV